MTLNDIVKMALTHLEYGTDDEAMATFYDRFVIYINDAIKLVAEELKMTYSDEITPDSNGSFNVGDLSKQCTKIVSVSQSGTALQTSSGEKFGDIVVPSTATVTVKYRYLPDYVTSAEDVPDIPSLFHPLLYLYVIHCHHNTRSSSSDYDRTKWLQQFLTQTRRLIRQSYATDDSFSFRNLPWQ